MVTDDVVLLGDEEQPEFGHVSQRLNLSAGTLHDDLGPIDNISNI